MHPFLRQAPPGGVGAKEVSALVSHLAVGRKVAASTQTHALSALLFLYREVLALPIGWVDDVERAKKPKRLPVVFTREEARAVLGHLREEAWLMECVRLRVKDLDVARLQLAVRDGKGGRDRVKVLPSSPVEPLWRQLDRARALHELDVREGSGASTSPTRSQGNTFRQIGSGRGSTYFRRATGPLTRGRDVSSATTSPRQCSGRR